MKTRQQVFLPPSDRRLGDRYELLECLGDGSYGWVWHARRLEDGQPVAVKIPKRQSELDARLAEGKPLIGLEPHRNLVAVYWMGRVMPEGTYAIEMEYFPSSTLALLLDGHDQGFIASYERVLEIYGQVLSGVAHLHAHGISHGDIKPQNILVSGSWAKVTDFGSSLQGDELFVRPRENGGTLLYSAPESTLGWEHEPAFSDWALADIYSLGVLLYQMVTSRLPHDTLSQVVRHAAYPKPREANATVSRGLDEFILRALARKPAERWPDLASMQAAFAAARREQLAHSPLRRSLARVAAGSDWSTAVLERLGAGACAEAQQLALGAYRSTHEPEAFFLALSAAAEDDRHFECLRLIDQYPECLEDSSPFASRVRRLALGSALQLRDVHRASGLVERCLSDDPTSVGLRLKKASILGLQARYSEAIEVLLLLNRECPQRANILKRLALAHEQLRDIGKAVAFLRAYVRLIPEDMAAQGKLGQLLAVSV